VPEVANRTRITIVQHPRERFHPIGTARIARLGLANASLLVPRAVAPRSLRLPLDLAPGSALLFPGPGARDLAELGALERPSGLVVLDGTWSHARALLRENPALRSLPQVSLQPRAPSRYRIRKQPRSHFISTIEAIVEALRLLEPETQGLDGLLRAFDWMIDEQLVYAHRSPRRRLRRMARRGSLAPPLSLPDSV
jgi:DTW domain-containing protein YfiP